MRKSQARPAPSVGEGSITRESSKGRAPGSPRTGGKSKRSKTCVPQTSTGKRTLRHRNPAGRKGPLWVKLAGGTEEGGALPWGALVNRCELFERGRSNSSSTAISSRGSRARLEKVGRGHAFDLICNAQRRVSTRPSHAPASSWHVECTRSLIPIIPKPSRHGPTRRRPPSPACHGVGATA
jgi:hypothetical protein